MPGYTAKRIKFLNGERISVLKQPNGLPVHEVVLFVAGYRKKGRAANTIHQVCSTLALLYNHVSSPDIDLDLVKRFESGRFLSAPELGRIAELAQYMADDIDRDEQARSLKKVINLESVRLRRSVRRPARKPVDSATHANRIRCIAGYLKFLAEYIEERLPEDKAKNLSAEAIRGLKSLLAHVPRVSKRAKLNARKGLSEEDQSRVLETVLPDSPTNPWKSPYVRLRNWLIVVLLLATGMRRGELLGLQVRDIHARESKLRIVRRADAEDDLRTKQPNAKTNDREIELAGPVMKRLWAFINHDRNAIRRARRIPQVIVSDEGDALSEASIDKLFRELRQACPGLPGSLTSHVMRHTWNERFSEQAEKLGLTDVVEEKARANQQGWVEGSKMGATYTRRHTERKGRAVSLSLQEKLEESLDGKK